MHELSRIHRFHQHWEAAASLQLRRGDPSAFDAYEAHQRIVAGPFDEHVDRIAKEWLGLTADGKTVAITATTNQHVDAINDTVQHARLTVGQLDPDAVVPIAGDEHAYLGDVIVTRRNDRELRTSTGEPVRNRDLWVVTATHGRWSVTVSHLGGHGDRHPPRRLRPAGMCVSATPPPNTATKATPSTSASPSSPPPPPIAGCTSG